MKKTLRYGDFLGVVRLKQHGISYNDLVRVERAAREH